MYKKKKKKSFHEDKNLVLLFKYKKNKLNFKRFVSAVKF